MGVDEAFLDVTDRVGRSFEKARKLAGELKKEISATEKITCSIGIGPNKLIAKIATGRQKPDGLTLVKPEEVQQFLSPLPVRELVGVGRKIGKTLQNLGIKTVGELAASEVNMLVSNFGKSLATYLRNAAFGIDKSPVQQRGHAESVSRIITLKEDTRNFNTSMEEVCKLAEDVHSSVVKQGFSFRSVSIIAIMGDLTVHSRSRTFESATKELELVKKTAKELYEQVLRDEQRRSVRRVGVKLSNFTEEKGQKQLVEFLE